jgi:hypothetical protein
MPNDATRASAEAMPKINRRKALSLAGVCALAVGAGVSPGVAAEADDNLGDLDALIEEHATAYAENCDLWRAVGDLDNEPSSKVRVGYILRGRDDEGNDIKEPHFAYSVESIEQHFERYKEPNRSIFGSGPGGEERVRKIEERYAELIREKTDEFLALEADKRRREDACGFTGALEAAVASTQSVRDIEARIMDFAPRSLGAAQRLAQWALAAYESDCHCVYDAEDLPVMALGALAKAVQS